MVKIGPRAYMWGSTAYNAVKFFMPTRVTAAEVLNQRSTPRQCLYSVKEVREAEFGSAPHGLNDATSLLTTDHK
jgi:hypothetical protein